MFAFVGAKGGVGTTTTAVNVATALAKLSTGRRCSIDLHLAYGDAAVFLGADARFSLLDALENLHRLDAEFLKSLVVPHRSGLDLLRVRGPAGHARCRRAAARLRRSQLAASQYAYTVLDVPRSDLTVLDSARRRRQPRGRREPGARHRPQRRAHGRGAAAALSEDERLDRCINRTDGRAEISQQDVEKAVGGAHRAPGSRATTAARCWRCTKGVRWRSTITTSSRRRSPRSPAIWPASSTKKAERATGGFKGLLSGRR